ncbi:MAG: NADH:flavin oxidoreductase [Synergistaceae bacterium]|jgi:2,4-dienoyl-CoA reductase-like NADH-dependent reductase (Old Yellow Enzyme family)|nr:NADH:flavin oxidoreductase [Synergistaceae bacterium]
MKTLFDGARIGSLSLQNRLIRSAVADKTFDGYVDESMIDTYEKLASAGVGAIITGATLVDGEEKLLPIATLCSDSFVPGHRKLVGAVHKYDVRIIAQLAYIGSYTATGDYGGLITLAPSPVPNLLTGTQSREMRLGEIKLIQKKFADAALRAKNAGYDAVEIHCAHSLLLSQFLTPHYNRRTDDYGGPIENRARMITETYFAIRKATGYDFPVWVKINSTDGIDDGIDEDDVMCLCGLLTKAGVEAIEVSGNFTPARFKPGPYFRDAAERIADENNVTVVLTGGNRKFSDMTAMLNTTNVHFFGMARPFIREPKLMERFRREAEI